MIIDDSYNASPNSVKEALAVIERTPQQKKVVILGDMLELGALSEEAHKEIGRLVAKISPWQLVAVGNLAQGIIAGAVEAGYSQEKISWYENSDLAKEAVRNNIEPESVILIKGSQGARMEKITKELLQDPMSASNVLPRQYGKWLE
ncbi:hypothetical protein IPM19_03275 [bacterium]|nr:MAG: hypothetical protein IPM19_03275 [bacterium]